MKIIGLEEHCWTPELDEALMQVEGKYRDDSVAFFKTKEVGTGLAIWATEG